MGEQQTGLVDMSPELIFSKGIVRRIVKLDKEVKMVSLDAIFLIAKAAETFISEFSKESMEFSNNRYAQQTTTHPRSTSSSSPPPPPPPPLAPLAPPPPLEPQEHIASNTASATATASASASVTASTIANSPTPPQPESAPTLASSSVEVSHPATSNADAVGVTIATNEDEHQDNDEHWLRYDDVYNALQVQKDCGKDWSFLDLILTKPPHGNYTDESVRKDGDVCVCMKLCCIVVKLIIFFSVFPTITALLMNH
jgi:hypothetical protein